MTRTGFLALLASPLLLMFRSNPSHEQELADDILSQMQKNWDSQQLYRSPYQLQLYVSQQNIDLLKSQVSEFPEQLAVVDNQLYWNGCRCVAPRSFE